MDARPMPANENEPKSITAPPMPIVRINDDMMRLRVEPMFNLDSIILLMPTDAMEPNRRSMMPPRTACGIVCITAPTLPISASTTAETPAMRSTEGSVTFVSDTAPVTSEYVVIGAPPRNAARQQESPSPSNVR